MNKLYKCLLWSLFTICLLSSYTSYASWHNWFNKDLLSISYKKRGSGHIEIKAEVFYPNVNRQAFFNLLNDIDNAATWLSNIESVSVLAKPNSAENIVLTRLNAPWPVKDRVMLTHSCHKALSNTVSKLFIRAVPKAQRAAYMSEDLSDSFIFVSPVDGYWQLEEKDSGLFITHQIYADPQGKIPIWLSNKTALKGVKKTFQNMADKIYNTQYKGENNFTTSLCSAFE